MKKKYLFLFVLLSFLIFLFFIKKNNCSNSQAKTYLINNKNYCLLTASNQEQWEKGLMFYKKPVDFDGMIFVFPDKQVRSFWNKNTYLGLDIYWMDGETLIGKSYLPSILKSKEIVIVESQKKVDRVIELVR